jgi:hypothetical protein
VIYPRSDYELSATFSYGKVTDKENDSYVEVTAFPGAVSIDQFADACQKFDGESLALYYTPQTARVLASEINRLADLAEEKA